MDGAGSARTSSGTGEPETFFTLLDYGLFVAMLAVSGLIGLYYGFFSKRKQNNPAEYSLGNQEMSIFPIAASLIVSHVSGISMLAIPADIYANGSQYVMTFICAILVSISLIYIYIPVFYDLKCASCFIYLEKRFDRRVRMTASLVYTMNSILFMPIVVYVPALAFNQVSGINIHYVTIAICALCIFYTTLGGLRAVVWTDTIQYISIMGAIIAVIIVGTLAQGGIGNVFEAAERGGRLIFFDMTPNPLVRSSFWTVSIGLSVMWISLMGASQGTIQRFLSLPSQKQGTRCVLIFCIGIIVIKITTCYLGILLYAKYENCDPLAAGNIKKIDQILPYYALHIFKDLPGLTGIFIAGIFAGALSTMSSNLNTLSASIFEDFIKPGFKNLSPKVSSHIMKSIVLCFGLVMLSLVFLVETLGAIMQLAFSVNGWTAGASLGIFTMGMLSRKGIIAGAITSLICVGIILVGAQVSPKPPTLPFSNEGCETNSIARESRTQWIKQIVAYENVPWLFRINFMYYALIGFIVLMVVAYPVSIMTGGYEYEEVDERLLAPFMRVMDYNAKEMKFIKVPSDVSDEDKELNKEEA